VRFIVDIIEEPLPEPVKFDNNTLRSAVEEFKNDPSTTEEKYGKIGTWDVSNVEDMKELFKDAIDFDENISKWDTSKVTDMSYMFSGATSFNHPLDWNTKNVINMSYMFHNATTFNQTIDFDVYCEDNGKLRGGSDFPEGWTSPGGWNRWNERGLDMRHMFDGASNFTRILGGPDHQRWKVWQDLTNGGSHRMSQFCRKLNMGNMFKGTKKPTQNYIKDERNGLDRDNLICDSCPEERPYAREYENTGKYNCYPHASWEQESMDYATNNWRAHHELGACTPNPNTYNLDVSNQCIEHSEKLLLDVNMLPDGRNAVRPLCTETNTTNCIHWDPRDAFCP
jgi:surface protein